MGLNRSKKIHKAHGPSENFGFTKDELRKIRNLKTPYGVQCALDAMPYHLENTAWSPGWVLKKNTAHCLEGAIFAAAALRVLGHPPLILDFESVGDTDHVLAIYQVNGCWGAVGKSNFTGCRWREPVYRSLRELAMSYFHIYFNMRRERTLRTFSRPVNLKRFDHLHWMTTDKPVWFVAEHLLEISHTRLLTTRQEKLLTRVDDRTFRAECVDRVVKPKV